ncbi:immunoglobulin superfamily member 2-like [Betta splendens]|uniref:immunoglobulin superfamily member 2-like n=1 Tax=Betta splendens TaxID=158456 RepID=UPI0010F5EB9A|nr:immunoglobulin superfamily member 2-like [Betta splendens]
MKPYLCSTLLLWLGVFMDCGEAQVMTEVPVGPLYRVEGSPLIISCNVSGFARKLSQKQFEFRIKKPAKPVEINIISSEDNFFAYAMYADRVRNKDITLEYVNANSVLFKIGTLQKDDEGEYECTVLNKEGSYRGTYSAVITVKVLDNSLSVSSSEPATLDLNEGDPLALTCQASSNTIQHTHLSFAWYLQAPGEDAARTIVTLDKDFVLSAGQEFDARFRAGHIRLDKVGEAEYQLKMDELQVSDRGRIYCHAHEWVQDPDRSWYCVTDQKSGETQVNVKAREVESDTSPLLVRITAQQSVLYEGQGLSLTCSIDTPDLEQKFFSVAWLWGNVSLATLGPTGVLSVGPDYRSRENEGELRASRSGLRDYRLVLMPVRTTDHGEYTCRAWPQERGQDGRFVQGGAQDSKPQLVSISASESGITVEMQGNFTVNEGDRLKLTCKVGGVKGQLSVTWLHKSASAPAAAFADVISLSQEGVAEKGAEFRSRKVRAERPAGDVFTLELDEVTPSSSGVYQCAVSEWKTNSKTNSQSQTKTVTVTPIDKFAKVSLKSRNSRVTLGENVELMCRVTGPRMPVTVTWSLQRDGTTPDNILTLYFDGSISWFGSHQRYQLRVENQKSQVVHYLLITGATYREAGAYQCSVSVFLQNAHRKLPPSNLLAVVVQKPVYDLRLAEKEQQQLSVMEGEDVEFKCSVVSDPSNPLPFYKVAWFYSGPGSSESSVSLVELDHMGVLRFPENQALRGLQGRLHLSRPARSSFLLSIQRAREGDGGSYQCRAELYQQDPEGVWQQEAADSGGPVELSVNVTENNLLLKMEESEMNVTSDFTIPCNIDRQSSNDSEFQVTWFWQSRDDAKPRPIFTSRRDSTLQDRSGKDFQLRFYRPLSNQFSLSVLMPGPATSGLYFCEVEEWLPSLSRSWRKVAVEKSKSLTINVQTDARASSDAVCMSVAWIGVLAAVTALSLLAVLGLALKMCLCSVSGGKKGAQSLWAEQLPLDTKPGAEG